MFGIYLIVHTEQIKAFKHANVHLLDLRVSVFLEGREEGWGSVRVQGKLVRGPRPGVRAEQVVRPLQYWGDRVCTTCKQTPLLKGIKVHAWVRAGS